MKQETELPELAEGEVYIGAIGDKNGDFHHVILLPGDSGDATWQEQMDWAKSINGNLPTRVEQAMLWAHHRDLFKREWYWSNETHHRDSGCAWYQSFSSGIQHNFRKVSALRARAVRRLIIQ
ncbi:hypothetical protein X947_6081 [Burkholderia pseudomallei MSHR7334]|uniref:DUF1566 domain-containing protein n=1 Tax=Burkholderia pseudomallei TaxID=28450 RepID=UPI000531B010|nr:DUF1566 domain-containing protein [Burkholderia pseudomallei]KGS89840.1 hypothetical protein X947_6081 [Burkholderia pseudomallei MSHR7334]